MRTSIPRLHSVKLKAGGARLHVLKGGGYDLRDEYAAVTREVAKSHDGRIAGFAVVVWGPDNASTCACRVGNASTIPSILAPDFVRNRLLADRIESWTIETINQKDR